MPEDYNPWLNGAASYFDGVYDLGDCKVTIVSGLSSVSVDYPFEYPEIGDGWYFQGAESDELIKNMCWRWENSCETPDDCVRFIISHFV